MEIALVVLYVTPSDVVIRQETTDCEPVALVSCAKTDPLARPLEEEVPNWAATRVVCPSVVTT